MEELSMEGEEEKPSRKRKIRESDATLIRSPYVKVVVDNQEINMLWANNSSVLWMDMTEPRCCFICLHSISNISGLGLGFWNEEWFNFRFV